MTRILVQRGSGSSSSNQNRSSVPSSSNAPTQPQTVPPQVNSAVKSDGTSNEGNEQVIIDELPEQSASSGNKTTNSDDFSHGSTEQAKNVDNGSIDGAKVVNDANQVDLVRGYGGLVITEHTKLESDGRNDDTMQSAIGVSQPPPPPVPPPKPSGSNSNLRRHVSGASDSPRIGPSRRPDRKSVV